MRELLEQNKGSTCLCVNWQQGSLSLWPEHARKELTWGGSSWLDQGLCQGPLHLAKCLEKGDVMQGASTRPTCYRSPSSRSFVCVGQKFSLKGLKLWSTFEQYKFLKIFPRTLQSPYYLSALPFLACFFFTTPW